MFFKVPLSIICGASTWIHQVIELAAVCCAFDSTAGLLLPMALAVRGPKPAITHNSLRRIDVQNFSASTCLLTSQPQSRSLTATSKAAGMQACNAIVNKGSWKQREAHLLPTSPSQCEESIHDPLHMMVMATMLKQPAGGPAQHIGSELLALLPADSQQQCSEQRAGRQQPTA
jgi:hypothetical protein